MTSSSALNPEESTKYQNCSKSSTMSVSLEALAMACIDCFSKAIDLEEWERRDLEFSPPHLLAEDDDEQEKGKEKADHGMKLRRSTERGEQLQVTSKKMWVNVSNIFRSVTGLTRDYKAHTSRH